MLTMEVTQQLQATIKELIGQEYGLEVEDVFIEHPGNETWGDYATNVPMKIAGLAKQPPLEIAKNLSYKIGKEAVKFTWQDREWDLFESVSFAPPGFINFKLSSEWLAFVLSQIMESGEAYGASILGEGKKVMVEYSQPNPNKPLHIGHARNNFLGNSVVKLLAFSGHDVIAANYINDWGTHICKAMLMYQKYGEAVPTSKPDHYVGELYARFERESADNPQFAEEVAEMFRKLEAGDAETIALWEKIISWVYEGWKETYADQGVSFDVLFYQHNYKDSGKDIVNIALEKGIAEKDETGAIIARLEKYGIPDKVLLRADGTSIYSTQDLQLAKDTFENYNLDKRIYVVDVRQGDYFKQIFKILEILGFHWAQNLYHLAYGVVKLPEGSMSSRRGLVVYADEVLDTLVRKEKAEIGTSLKVTDNVDEIAKKVALAAYKYGLLKTDSSQDIVFDYDQVTKFEGNTGPYLMYTYARAQSVLAKAGGFDAKASIYKYVPEEPGKSVQRVLYQFPEITQAASQQYAPHLLCNYLFELAQRFNTFYASSPILTAETNDAKDFRLLLTAGTAQVLKNGLNLLGIEVVESM